MGGSSSKSKAEKEKAKWNKAAGGSSTQGDVIDMLTEVRNTFSATVRNTVPLTSPHAHTRTQAQLDEFREAFAAFDKDGGGSIDATELRALMASVGQIPTDDELHEMIRIADADGSGSVDFYEFVTLMAHKMADVRAAPARGPYLVALDPACSPYSCATGQVRVAPARCLLDLRLLVGRVHPGG